jgi:hypothetical protein
MAPKRRRREIPMLHRIPANFCGETRLAGTRADVVARLRFGEDDPAVDRQRVMSSPVGRQQNWKRSSMSVAWPGERSNDRAWRGGRARRRVCIRGEYGTSGSSIRDASSRVARTLAFALKRPLPRMSSLQVQLMRFLDSGFADAILQLGCSSFRVMKREMTARSLRK